MRKMSLAVASILGMCGAFAPGAILGDVKESPYFAPSFGGGGKARHGWQRKSGVIAQKRIAKKIRNRKKRGQ